MKNITFYIFLHPEVMWQLLVAVKQWWISEDVSENSEKGAH